MISYRPLMVLLADRGMSKRELMLKADISPNTMTKIRQNKEVSLSTILRICAVLSVRIENVVEIIGSAE